MIRTRLVAILFIISSLFISAKYNNHGNVEKQSLVTRIDHILLTPDDPLGLYKFLTEDLKLPPAWKYQSYGDFASGAGYAGNVNLEAALFSGNTIKTGSKITGIAFEPASGTEQLIINLNKMGIPHDKPQPFFQGTSENKTKLWTTVGINNFVSGSLIFTCEYHYPEGELDKYRMMLNGIMEKTKGGPAGILSVKEIIINVKNESVSLRKWRKFLSPLKEKNGLFLPENGPGIRIVRSTDSQISSVVFLVNSLKKVKEFLIRKDILGNEKKDEISTDPKKTFGILFSFTE